MTLTHGIRGVKLPRAYVFIILYYLEASLPVFYSLLHLIVLDFGVIYNAFFSLYPPSSSLLLALGCHWLFQSTITSNINEIWSMRAKYLGLFPKIYGWYSGHSNHYNYSPVFIIEGCIWLIRKIKERNEQVEWLIKDIQYEYLPWLRTVLFASNL